MGAAVDGPADLVAGRVSGHTLFVHGRAAVPRERGELPRGGGGHPRGFHAVCGVWRWAGAWAVYV
jgi:hypothetical protein